VICPHREPAFIGRAEIAIQAKLRDQTAITLRAVRIRTLLLSTSLAAVLFASPSARADDGDEWLGRDKALHFGAAAAISGVAYGAASLGVSPRSERVAVSLGAGLLAGAGKELYDLMGNGDPSWKDFTWDAIGAVFAAGVALGIDFAVRGSPSKNDPSDLGPGVKSALSRGLSFSW
jgi:putative lipoprotein